MDAQGSGALGVEAVCSCHLNISLHTRDHMLSDAFSVDMLAIISAVWAAA